MLAVLGSTPGTGNYLLPRWCIEAGRVTKKTAILVLVRPGRTSLSEFLVAKMGGGSVIRYRNDRHKDTFGCCWTLRNCLCGRNRPKWIGGKRVSHSAPPSGTASIAAIFRPAST